MYRGLADIVSEISYLDVKYEKILIALVGHARNVICLLPVR
jgi:hypothetical protein